MKCQALFPLKLRKLSLNMASVAAVVIGSFRVKVMYHLMSSTGQRRAVGNTSDYRCESDCKSRDREFDPGQVPYFCGD